jgi:phosphatidate cytidylyltransferase
MYLWEFRKTDGEARFGHFSPLINGIIYIPFMLHLGLYLTPAEQCMALGAAISSDIGGYYAGTLWGGKKLWPLVSPNKTWAGFFGGFVLCVSLCSALGWIGNARGWELLSLPWWTWPIAGVLLHLGAVAGDLFESALKRSLHAKDAGSILPGHGGMLDRIDSILWVIPLYLCLREFLLWCMSTWQALVEMGIV